MNKNLLFALLMLLALAPLKAQVLLYSEGFETDGEGTRYTTNTYLDCPNSDFFLRTNTNPVTPTTCTQQFGSTLTGLQGSFFWASEDIRTSTPVPLSRPPGDILTQSFSVAGHNTLTVSLYLATSNNNFTRWESSDSINIKASFDGGPFNTVGRFMGKGSPTVGTRLGIDSNLDGAITGADPSTNCDTIAFIKYTFSIPGTGNAMRIELDFDQAGGSEELAIDQLEIEGIFVGAPEINVVGNSQNILDGDTSPNTTDGTDFGSQNYCLGAVPKSFTIENTGTQPLLLTGLIFIGGNSSDFAIITQPSSNIPAGGSSPFTAIFNPTASGLRTTTLNIISNDADEGNYDFSVQGFGLPDTIPPSITCPPSDSVSNDSGLCTAAVNFANPTAADNCTNPTVSQASGLASGATFPVGTTTNVFQAIDADSNITTCSFTITVSDNEPPTALCLNDTLFLGSNGTVSLSIPAINGGSSDNCGPATLFATPNTFDTTDLGANNVTLFVTDGSGNTATCNAIVFIEDSVATSVPAPRVQGIHLAATPNPFIDRLQVSIDCNDCFPDEALMLRVWNMTGQVLLQFPLTSGIPSQAVALDLSAYPAGTYMLSLHHAGEVLTRMVIKH